MQGKGRTMMVRRVVDVCMTVLLLCLMAYQVTGEVAHEWIGIGMTVLFIVHQIFNRRWYRALFKGKYNSYRILTTVINVLLLLAFVLTAFCGMSMSGHAVPFLYGMAKVSFARSMHLTMSHWAFILMGLHLGMHIPAMASGLKLNDKIRIIISAVFCVIAAAVILGIIFNAVLPGEGASNFGNTGWNTTQETVDSEGNIPQDMAASEGNTVQEAATAEESTYNAGSTEQAEQNFPMIYHHGLIPTA